MVELSIILHPFRALLSQTDCMGSERGGEQATKMEVSIMTALRCPFQSLPS